MPEILEWEETDLMIYLCYRYLTSRWVKNPDIWFSCKTKEDFIVSRCCFPEVNSTSRKWGWNIEPTQNNSNSTCKDLRLMPWFHLFSARPVSVHQCISADMSSTRLRLRLSWTTGYESASKWCEVTHSWHQGDVELIIMIMMMMMMMVMTWRVELALEGLMRKENLPSSEGSRQWEADTRPARRSTLIK